MDPYKEHKEKAKAEAQKDKTDLANLIHAYKEVFLESPKGREVLEDILARCKIFQTTFTGNSSGFFLEGGRAIGFQILEMLEVSKFEDWEKIMEQNDG